MTIYTKTGDKGETSLFGGKRLSKSDLLIEAYGQIDELSSFIGLATAKIKSKKNTNFLVDIQKDLYQIMAYLSGAKINLDFLEKKVFYFEKKIDDLEKKLPKLNRFIIPGGTETSSLFHILRVVCRRCERSIVRLRINHSLKIIPYFNRLSDLFFVLARFYNKDREIVL